MFISDIKFVFENTHSVVIKPEHIGMFYVDDILTRVQRVSYNSIKEVTTTDALFIEIHRDANTEPLPPWMDDNNGKKTVFDRLGECDAVSVEFTISNNIGDGMRTRGKDYHITLPWDERDAFSNKCQSYFIGMNGNMYLAISYDMRVDEFFDKASVTVDSNWPYVHLNKGEM